MPIDLSQIVFNADLVGHFDGIFGEQVHILDAIELI